MSLLMTECLVVRHGIIMDQHHRDNFPQNEDDVFIYMFAMRDRYSHEMKNTYMISICNLSVF